MENGIGELLLQMRTEAGLSKGQFCHRDYEGALDLLGKYEVMKISEKPLHTQFIEQEKAQIEWLRSKDVDMTLDHVENAL